MFNKKFLPVVLGICLAQCAHAAEPGELIDGLTGVFGKHAGQRKSHPKGFCAAGDFVPSKEAKQLSSSALFTTAKVPAIARFSIGGGNPAAPDASRSARGLAVQFQLPKGDVINTATLSVPVFAAKDPDTFLGLLKAQAPDPTTGKPDAGKIAAFRDAHPDTKVQVEWLKNNAPPWSYATAQYYSIHAFNLVAKNKKVKPVRWAFVPEDGLRGLSADEIAAASPNFLQARLNERIQQGPIRWKLVVTLADKEDVLDDPTVIWPAERKTVELGVLTIQRVSEERGGECDAINFDPTLLGKQGITAGNDPILKARSPAYAVSYGQRLSGQ